jgi:hypothetical protein
MSPSNKSVFSILTMLIVAPLVAVGTLVYLHSARWGGAQAFLAVPFMAVFAVFITPVWLTYIPALIIVPIAMRRIAASRHFVAVGLPWLLLLAVVVGGIAGVCVLGPAALLASKDTDSLAADFLIAGAVAGAVSLVIICLIHRHGLRSA